MMSLLSDAIDFSSVHRVLLIKLRHHGDVLLASPVVATLKQHAPHIDIDALVYSDTAPMLVGHPGLSQIHTIDRAWKQQGLLAQAYAEWGLLTRLRRRHYNGIIHLTEHKRGAWLTRILNPQWAVAPDGRFGRFFARSFSHRYPVVCGNRRHTVEIHLDALRRLGISPSVATRRLVLVPGEEASITATEKLAACGIVPDMPFFVLHPVSRWFFKTWPIELVAALVDSLTARGDTVILTAAPTAQEQEMVAAIQAKLVRPVINLSGQLTLKELAVIIDRARLFIGVDSAPMHIAAAMGTPTIALFGPSGNIEWGPWQVPCRVLVSNHPCRPCGRDGCGGSKVSECLTAITPSTVLSSIDALLMETTE